MLRRFLVPALLCTAPFLVQACGSQSATSGSSGGATTGGTTTQSGGTSSATGGVIGGTGGMTTGSGGTTTSSGGSTTSTGGTTTALGGTTTASGGTAAGGTTASGGTTSASGGGTTQTGGTTTGSGGATTATGGANSGGATGSGGVTSAGGASTTGATTAAGTGGASATGGVSGTGGSSTTGGLEVWVSPTGNDDTGTGTKDSPLFSLCWDDSDNSIKKGGCYKLCPIGVGCNAAGGTIWVMDGTYKYTVTQKFGSSKLGTASAPFNVFAESGAKPVLDFSAMPVDDTSRGIQISGDYWHIKGLTVTKAGDTGIFVMGNNNTIEQCIAHHNQDAGIVIGVNSDRVGSGKNNLVLNCDSYANYDPATSGGNADGYGAKENAGGTGNIFRGCRAWENSDDGFDFYGWDSPITVDNCWVMNQSNTLYGSGSNGNGFKLGGNSVSAAHILKNLYAVSNGINAKSGSGNGNGFEANSNTASMPCSGTCGAWSNKTSGVHGSNITGVTVTSGPTADKMINASRNADGSLPDINSL